jgi:hypothetical protein
MPVMPTTCRSAWLSTTQKPKPCSASWAWTRSTKASLAARSRTPPSQAPTLGSPFMAAIAGRSASTAGRSTRRSVWIDH